MNLASKKSLIKRKKKKKWGEKWKIRNFQCKKRKFKSIITKNAKQKNY